jgi:protein TonB
VIAIENGIQGRVIIQFIVEKDGSISSAKYIRGVDPSLDKEAMRIVNAMPKWVPGKQKGESVRCFITIPIEFRIPKKETKVQTANDSII